ncbi:Tubulin monoglutamylase TTLL4, partial [Pseudolycoriella hygida]
MDTRDRLYPQSHRQQKLTLRRRCRSETLPQMGHVTIVGTPIDLDDPNELRRKSSLQQTVFRNRIHSKPHSPNVVLRNQESTKNIYSLRENRRNAAVSQLKTNTKENISVEYNDIDDSKDFCLREFELYKDRAVKRNDDFLSINKLQRMEKDDCESFVQDSLPDTHKRRARARSESEPHDIYHTRMSPNKTDSIERSNLVLKRCREDKPYICKNGYADTTLPAEFSTFVDAKTKLPPKPVKNLHYTKLVNTYYGSRPSTPCNSPRYTGNKSLNGNIRKLRTKGLKCKTMVVANPAPQRCITPDDEASHFKEECEEDSDGGGSSLEDDVDFGDVGEEDFNESFSDSEDFSAAIVSEPPNLNKKLSEANLLTESVKGSRPEHGPLTASLFPYVPPYITFADHLEKGPTMPAALTKVLKWKLTTITPIVIRKVLANTGFRLLRNDDSPDNQSNDSDDETNDWMGVWGKHMKSPCFRTIRSYQKINHIPGSFQIGRKDRIWRNLQTQMVRHGKNEFGFMPRTFVLPADMKQLHRLWPVYNNRNSKWIIKPPASARGTGIKVVNQWAQIPKRKPLIVQRYIDRPLLIDGSKFDLRLYVLVTSINPLRVYMHTDGLARFASVKYSTKADTLNDRYMHLTNYSINKLSNNYAKNEDASACQGHKWTLKSLWTHLAARGINTELLWAALRDLVLRTILAGENAINNLTKLNMGSKYNCFELFGIDVILNSELIPWLLEVNISPSLHSASPLDLHVKGPLVRALLNTVMFQVPPRIPLAKQHEVMAELGLTGQLCHDKRIFTTSVSKSDKLKHSHFSNRNLTKREDYLDDILKNLTSDDVRCLLVTEDELARSAPLERIFPSSITHKYLQFIDSPRYYNRLLDAWEHRYGGNQRDKGISLIRKLCEDKVHLIVPPAKKDSGSNTAPDNEGTTIQISDDESDQRKLTGINNIEATITTMKKAHIINEDSEIYQYFNGHKTNHHLNGVAASE